MTADLATLAAGLAGFSVMHSVLAASSVQRAFEKRGMSPRAYRLAYGALSALLLLALAPLVRAGFPEVWRAHGPWRLLLSAVQIGALAGLAWCARGFDVAQFLGLRAGRPGGGERPALAPGAQSSVSGPLQTGGAYALCRHPIYFFTGVFFSAWPSMHAGWLVIAVWIWAYSWIGSVFEERRLVEELGEPYRAYQAAHWRILPLGGWRRRPPLRVPPASD